MNCRVCNSELQEGAMICPNCGRMVVSFPELLPEALQECLKKERDFYEQQSAKEKDMQQNLFDKERKNEKLQKKIDAWKKLEENYGDFEETVKVLEKKTKLIESLNNELQDRKDYIAYMICSRCGTPFEKDANYCKKCKNPPQKRPKYEEKKRIEQ